MSTEADWREAARGIPVWDGCSCNWLAGGARPAPVGRVMVAPSRVGPAADADPLVLNVDRDVARWPARSTVPDLADPDTRTAYDRRLALALGAPGEEADRGAVAYVHEDYGCASLVVDAGPGVRGFTWSRSVRVGDSGPGHFDPLLARALAWPADKRVTT